jgi:hypothetical protein
LGWCCECAQRSESIAKIEIYFFFRCALPKQDTTRPPRTRQSCSLSAMSSTPTANVSLPPPTADLATTWSFLEEGVDHIMTKLQTGVSYSKYMSLYTVAYNYCTSSKMHGSAADSTAMANRSTFSPSLRQPPVVTGPATPISAGANLMGSDLYNNLIRYFVTHLKILRDVSCFSHLDPAPSRCCLLIGASLAI